MAEGQISGRHPPRILGDAALSESERGGSARDQRNYCRRPDLHPHLGIFLNVCC
jgi:hypothetical protein